MIKSAHYGDVTYFRVARTYAGRALYWTGVYFVDGLLVDSGPPNAAREAGCLFADLGVRACATTHHHEDHSGNHALLNERFSIVPLAHAAATGRLARPEPLQFYRRLAWGNPRPAACAPFGEWVHTDRFHFRVIHTPGHSDDHVVLYEPDRGWVFTGDLYLGPRLKYLRADEDVHALMDSLGRVAALEPRVLFCQHRGRVEHATRALRGKLESLLELKARVEQLHSAGWSATDIAGKLPGNDLLWRVWTGGHFSKLNFVRAILRRGESPAGD